QTFCTLFISIRINWCDSTTYRGKRTVNAVTKWLTRESVVLGLKATDAKHLCDEVATFVAHRQNIDQDVIFRALWRREQCGSTGLGHGIAIPHARIPGISDPVVLFARTRDPIPFDAPDR